MIRELHAYDLDDTLYRSPRPPTGYGLEWYALPQSLADAGPPGFDNRWNLTVLQAVRRSLNNPDAKVALLSARPHNLYLHDHIMRWMQRSGLHFDLIQLRPLEVARSEPYKAMAIGQWLAEYPAVERVVFWDDLESNREAVSSTVKYAGKQVLLGIP